MRLLFVNRLYWPDETATAQLLTDLAEALAADGHEVQVIASLPPGASVAPREMRSGVQIIRTSGTRLARRLGMAGKALDHFSFLRSAIDTLQREATPDSIIVSMTDPPLLGISASRAARKRGAALVHWVQDIYPEIAMELTRQRWLSVLVSARDRGWHAADGCVTLGADMAQVLQQHGVARDRIHIIPNPALRELSAAPDATSASLREAWELNGKFVIQYSGNLGRVHDLEPILDAAEELRGDTTIVFLFVGDGPQRGALQAAAEQRRLPSVRFIPPQPRRMLPASLRVGDLHLVTLRPGCERYVYPSKVAGSMSVGRGVVFIGPKTSEVAQFISRGQAGVVFSGDEMKQLAATLKALARNPIEVARLGANAARVAPTTGRHLEAWKAVLREITQRRTVLAAP